MFFVINLNKFIVIKEVFAMAGELKNRERFSSTIKPETHKRLREYSEASGVPISKILDLALNKYLDSVKR